jgi:hypothetical protein
MKGVGLGRLMGGIRSNLFLFIVCRVTGEQVPLPKSDRNKGEIPGAYVVATASVKTHLPSCIANTNVTP